MKATLFGAALLLLTSADAAQAAQPNPLVGAWRLVRIDEQDAGGRLVHHRGLKGSLIYTSDGQVSVQVSYPTDDLSNDYVRNGYEASFGSYTVDAKAHRMVHHIEGANVRRLVGTDLPRAFELSGRRLTIRSVRPEEHWAAIWERD
jgi:hypothetical protein